MKRGKKEWWKRIWFKREKHFRIRVNMDPCVYIREYVEVPGEKDVDGIFLPLEEKGFLDNSRFYLNENFLSDELKLARFFSELINDIKCGRMEKLYDLSDLLSYEVNELNRILKKGDGKLFLCKRKVGNLILLLMFLMVILEMDIAELINPSAFEDYENV